MSEHGRDGRTLPWRMFDRTIRPFALSVSLATFVLTIGILFGIYSSVLVASPLVMWLGVSREQFIKVKKPGVDGANEDGAVV